MKSLVTLFLALYTLCCFSQDSFYNTVNLGDYAVGYSFSIQLNENQNYSQHHYIGSAPMFMQVWFPTEKTANVKTLAYGDFRKSVIPKNLREVYDTLAHEIDLSFIDYNLTYEVKTGDSIKYPIPYDEVLKVIKSTKTASVLKPLPQKLNFPVIVYHHGAQGLSDENYLMAEYFASRGYIFISANYHLPFDGLPYAHTTGYIDHTSFLKKSIEYARSITTHPNVYFIGHSWGAQIGLQTLIKEGSAQGFVSLETTLEFKSHTNKIKEMWPEIFDIVQTQKVKYPMPMLFVANTQEDKPFDFFSHVGGKQVYFASAKDEFDHESYTSGFLMRLLHNTQFPQHDSVAMQQQLQLYNAHLQLIEAFFNEVKSGKPLDPTPFLTNFYLHSIR